MRARHVPCRRHRPWGLEFVRYRPDVEVVDPKFDQWLKRVLDRASHYTADSVTSEGQTIRSAHATGYGLARAEIEISHTCPSRN